MPINVFAQVSPNQFSGFHTKFDSVSAVATPDVIFVDVPQRASARIKLSFRDHMNDGLSPKLLINYARNTAGQVQRSAVREPTSPCCLLFLLFFALFAFFCFCLFVLFVCLFVCLGTEKKMRSRGVKCACCI